MLTNKITGFSADLLNTVRGILGEAKKCGDCGCAQCECEKEEAKEGYVPTADEPTDANKKTADKVRALLAKEKKPVKEEIDADLEAELKATRQTTKSIRGHSRGAMGRAVMKKERNLAQARMDRAARGEMKKEEADYLEKDLKKRKDNNDKAIKDMKKMGSPMRNPHFGEEAEQVDEVSKATLGRYINKAKDSVDLTAWRQGYKEAGAGNPSKQLEKKLSKRHKGIETAVKKLTKEDAEQIDELSKGTMGRYINKAATKMGSQGVTAGLKIAADEKSSKNFKDMGKREKGIATAVKKLTKEEQDFVDSLNADTLDEARGRPRKASAKDFTIHPKTKEKLMHNNPADMKRIERLQKNGILEKPKVEAGQHIMNQLQKAKTSMTGGSTINFTHGDSKHVSGTHAARLLDKYAGMKPNEKEDFQKKIGHSHEQLMKHV